MSAPANSPGRAAVLREGPRKSPIRRVFLDRDGTINVAPPAGQYVTSAAELELLPGAGEAIGLLNHAHVWTAVVTNQRAIARGLMTERDLLAIHVSLQAQLARHGAHLDAIYHCPHALDTCTCRKPQPGMLLRARREHPDLDFATAALIGDKLSDIQAGRRVGAATVLLAGDHGDSNADHVAETLAQAVQWLTAERGLAPSHRQD